MKTKKRSERRETNKESFNRKIKNSYFKASTQTPNLARASEEGKDFNRRVVSNG